MGIFTGMDYVIDISYSDYSDIYIRYHNNQITKPRKKSRGKKDVKM